ncbi:DNA-3-methyladenine glycosylase family protein [Dactylosporangium siamense]|uniref:3-methyladenine DNA glycosylase n=1 Tax=Dactylosporangium siamense TaxID=685454 RepID=A0A919PHQ7_9ACTN|nr:DNA-3-methyladenine glycosylase 2 family protein [Dactylosporangium siamense]GIG44159.1 3-methyladenine DNA glycosylase [Dactylosporangium siamense]
MRTFPTPPRFDLAGTLQGLALIHGDPTLSVGAREGWFATRTPSGAGTLHLALTGASLVATAYGPGADWLLDRADAVAGLRDDVTGFAELARQHPLVHRLAREHSGLRIGATGRVFHHLVPAVLGQKVTGKEARDGYVRLLRHFSTDPAPGPNPRLKLPPEPAAIAAAPYWVFHPFGIEQKRADALRRVAAEASRLERCATAAEATARLVSIRGIGPWTAAEVTRAAYGDADAVSVGDYHIKNVVTYALTGAPRGTDEHMLELLAPYAGHRGRVCGLLAAAGITAPKFGPRVALRAFARY